MKRHPGGEAHTLRLLELAALPEGCRVLDLGAGDGESVALLRGRGFAAEGIDLRARLPLVRRGDLLRAPYPDGSFDALLSECAFFISGDPRGALREARRLLKSGGKLLLADVFFPDEKSLLAGAGFRVLAREDCTEDWTEYYLEALWSGRDESCGCPIPRGKCRYLIMILEACDDGSV